MHDRVVVGVLIGIKGTPPTCTTNTAANVPVKQRADLQMRVVVAQQTPPLVPPDDVHLQYDSKKVKIVQLVV